ncbi:MAG TPA: toll/interleukin-1 receptor domain-containing protein, partial [Pyrinomonadaceae bacterium]|nr:toll/interleukin-1 receptor domain-containing protein [Pyrinomonadaceae bacterium]
MSDIFISYDREDQKSAETIAEALEQAGWSLWWDRRLHYGEHFDDVIERELNVAKCVIVLWSGQSVQSEYVKAEAAHALKLKKVLPVAIEEVELPFRFAGLHTLFLIGWDGSASSAAFQGLLEGVSHMVGKPQKQAKGQKAARSSTDGWVVDNLGVLVKEVTPSSTEGWAERNERILFDALQKLVREGEKGFLTASIGKYWISFSAEGRGDA